MKNKQKKVSFFHVLRVYLPMCFKTCPLYITIWFLVVTTSSIISGIMPKTTQYFFDSVAQSVSSGVVYVMVPLLIYIFFILAKQLIRAVNLYMDQHLASKLNRTALFAYHKKANKLGAITYENTAELDHINKAAQGAKTISMVFFCIIGFIPWCIPYFSIMGTYLFNVKPILLIMFAIILLPMLLLQLVNVKIYSKMEEELAPTRREMTFNNRYLTDREFYKETRGLGAFSYFRRLLKETSVLFGKKTWKAERKAGLWSILARIFGVLSYCSVFIMLFYLFITAQITVGAFLGIVTSIDMMFGMMDDLIFLTIGGISRNIGPAVNFIEFLERPDREYADADFNIDAGITLKNVSFSYPNADIKALDNINLHIKKGETVAIVGVNGAGKSTLFKLLTGLYPASSGEVLIGGLDIKNVAPDKIYTHISGVFQNYQRYKMTFKDNVSISNIEDIDVDKIKSVNTQVNIFEDEKIDEMMETMLSREFDGIDLSGGKWQRTAIARGLYRNHDLIMLDEPTAAIDPIEETYIYKSFADLTRDKTSVLITHRLGAAKIADRIILVSDGQIKEEGTHDQLISSGGLYAEMYQSQSSWYEQ